jgi:hypothetical protein
MPILNHEVEDLVEGKNFAGVCLIVDDSSNFLPADLFVSEVLLLHKGNFLERFHLQQLHKRLRSQLGFIVEVFVQAVSCKQSNCDS